MAALRLAWLLHFAGALAPQGGAPAAAAMAAPSSFRDLAVLAHLACADALLALSLLFPVRAWLPPAFHRLPHAHSRRMRCPADASPCPIAAIVAGCLLLLLPGAHEDRLVNRPQGGAAPSAASKTILI